MKKLLLPFIALFILTNDLVAQFRVVGYFPNWSSNYQNTAISTYEDKLTHVNIAFINPTNDAGDLGPTNNLSNVVNAFHNNNVKVLASLAGAISNQNTKNRWANLLSDANRAAFVNKITQFALDYGLDGIDVDLEGDMIDGNYTKFIEDLSASLKPHNLLLTAAVAKWNGGSVSSTALAKFDFINLMAYDKTGPWAPSNIGQHSSYNHAVDDLDYWENRGVDSDKLVLGVPFYGHYFGASTGSYAFNHIVGLAAGNENLDEYNLGDGNTVYYNGIPTIKDKTLLALERAGGIMIWELTQDATGSKSLLSAIDEVIKESSNNEFPIATLLAPTQDTTAVEGDPIVFKVSASDPDGSIDKVEFYLVGMKIGEALTSPYNLTWSNAGPGTHKVYARARDNVGFYTYTDTITITVTAVTEQTPKNGVPWAIPGKIEAEDYDLGGINVAYYDNTTGNEGKVYRTDDVDIETSLDIGGGYHIGWVKPGEWLEYTVDIDSSGKYDIIVRVASNVGNGKFHIEMDGVDITGQQSVQATGTWQSFKDHLISGVELTEGVKVMRLAIDAGEFNTNYFEFVPASPSTSTQNNAIISYINLYPNPVTDYALASFSLKQASHVKMVICDLSGKEIKVVMDETVGNTEQVISFPTSDLEKGIYLLKVVTSEGITMKKLIKN
ncbi:MAG TPA: glycosyl hydrolase family 18 protein [Cytophagaceae bacterium]